MDSMAGHDSASNSESEGRRLPLKPLLAGGIALVFIVALVTADLATPLRATLAWIDGLGWWAPAGFVVAYSIACVLLIPATLLTVGAGVVFGFVRGTVYTLFAATAGAATAFLVARYVARRRIAPWLASRPSFRAMDQAVAAEGWKIVVLTRLSPIFPFTILNYAFGLTRIPLRHYVAASAAGMIPGTVMYVYMGDLAGDLAELDSLAHRSSFEWLLLGIALIATIALTVFVARLARRALESKVK